MMGAHNHVPIDEEDSYDEESDQEVIPSGGVSVKPGKSFLFGNKE